MGFLAFTLSPLGGSVGSGGDGGVGEGPGTTAAPTQPEAEAAAYTRRLDFGLKILGIRMTRTLHAKYFGHQGFRVWAAGFPGAARELELWGSRALRPRI